MSFLMEMIVLNPVLYPFNKRTFLYLSNLFLGSKFSIPSGVNARDLKKGTVTMAYL